MRDALVNVVDDIRDVEDGRAVRKDDCEVLYVLGLLRHVALHDVVKLDYALLGHPEHRDDACLAVARSLLDLVGMAARKKLVYDFEMALHVLRLVEHFLVPVEAEPLHAVEEDGDGLGRGALEVRVLDA